MTFIIGDLHGQIAVFRRLLRETGLADAAGHWTGGEARLWLLGDLYDRGPDGIACQDLTMQLEQEAAAVGGFVGCLLGNHDLLILAVRLMPDAPIEPGAESFQELWLDNGGQQSDLARLDAARVAWLRRLPALALEGDTLLLHADAAFYHGYGATLAAVNARIAALLAGDDPQEWSRLALDFTEHDAFWKQPAVAEATLATFGGARLAHGHTPIAKLSRQRDQQVTAALVYHGGLCVNCDGGIYRGGPGFVYELRTT